MDSPIPPFVEEIDFDSIELFEVVGKGTFGTVKKGRWGDKDVAVKLIETEQERAAFLVEVRQLSRVDHPNIVKLYGACTKPSNVCLVMEYAEGGSLYNVLHRMPNTHYTAAHAFSWALQCASGVAYLHNMKPKALIHRDLKPPNMLLILNGTVLKICDFGTACDLQTVMTNNKGSAAWMAPEVFEGSNYSEKCDVFSWGIILWEVLTRKKPFDNIGGPAFRIMWAVHSGDRPPLISGCPSLLEELMTSCWAKSPSDRPSMSEVEHKLKMISRFFKGGNDPIIVLTPDTDQPDSDENRIGQEKMEQLNIASVGTGSSTCIGTSILPPTSLQPHGGPTLMNPLVSPSGNKSRSPEQRSVRVKDSGKRLSADLSTVLEKPIHGHRRSGSWGTPLHPTQQSPVRPTGPVLQAGSRESLIPLHLRTSPRPSPPAPLRMEIGIPAWPSPNSNSGDETPIFSNLNAHLLLEPKFQPLPPAPNCPESLSLYESHCQMAQEFLRVQTEMEVIKKRKEELSKSSQREQLSTSRENLKAFLELRNEKDALLELRKNLKKQLEVMKAQSKPKQNEEWVLL